MDKKIVGSNYKRQRILDALTAAEIVSQSGKWYYLDLAALGALGFSLADFQRGEPGSEMLSFLASIDDEEPGV